MSNSRLGPRRGDRDITSLDCGRDVSRAPPDNGWGPRGEVSAPGCSLELSHTPPNDDWGPQGEVISPFGHVDFDNGWDLPADVRYLRDMCYLPNMPFDNRLDVPQSSSGSHSHTDSETLEDGRDVHVHDHANADPLLNIPPHQALSPTQPLDRISILSDSPLEDVPAHALLSLSHLAKEHCYDRCNY